VPGPFSVRAAALAAAVGMLTAAAPASVAAPVAAPARTWAAAGQATIHPGIMTDTAGGPCTANFVFTDAEGAVYIGQAAHCALPEAATDVNGCRSASLPLGTPVGLGSSGVTGRIAYSSWLTMQERAESDAAACANNDFALIRVPGDEVGKVNPSVPVFGGPTGVATGPLAYGDRVMTYGNSNLRGGIEEFSPQRGFAVGTGAGGWYHLVYTVLPGVPGDSGSGFLDAQGRAFGDLIDVNPFPPASNGVGDLSRQLAYARAHSGISGLELVPGTEKFTGG
jgi:hypothetical protein